MPVSVMPATVNGAAITAPIANGHDVKVKLPDIDPSKLTIERAKTLKPLPVPESLVFGQTSTDHMLIMEFDPELGWGAPAIKPYAPLQLDPACSIFHYTPAVFEGMKAFRGPNGRPRLFRPDLNMERMTRSADRVALPPFDHVALLTLIKRLVAVEERWIPNKRGYSLYIRPTYIGTRPAIGVTRSTHGMLFVIVSPTGPYFPTGFKPVSLLGNYDAVRAWPGGTGAYKLGLNYAPCFKPQLEASKKGYQQILWILGQDRQVTEVGQMNFFIVVRREDGGFNVITPELDGTILPGVTRDSILQLASAHVVDHKSPDSLSTAEVVLPELHVQEKHLTMLEIVEYHERGVLTEAFGAGTAAILCPVSKIGYEERDLVLPEYKGGLGPVGRAMWERIVEIQEGRRPSPWSVEIDAERD